MTEMYADKLASQDNKVGSYKLPLWTSVVTDQDSGVEAKIRRFFWVYTEKI